MKSPLITIAAIVGLLTALALPVAAEDDPDHGKPGHEHADKGHGHDADKGHEDKAHFKAKVPADVKEAWSQIAGGLATAETDLAASKLDAVHEFGEQLEASAHYLHDNSSMVSGEAKGRLDSTLAQLDKIADALHHAAEAKDNAKIGQEIKKAKSLLPLIEAQYPAGTLN